MRCAGVDVGGIRKGFDVVVIEPDWRGLRLLWPPRREQTVQGALALLSQSEPIVIAVDSPVSCASQDRSHGTARER